MSADISSKRISELTPEMTITIHVVETIDYWRTTTVAELVESADPHGIFDETATLDDVMTEGYEVSGFGEWIERYGDVRSQERTIIEGEGEEV